MGVDEAARLLNDGAQLLERLDILRFRRAHRCRPLVEARLDRVERLAQPYSEAGPGNWSLLWPGIRIVPPNQHRLLVGDVARPKLNPHRNALERPLVVLPADLLLLRPVDLHAQASVQQLAA